MQKLRNIVNARDHDLKPAFRAEFEPVAQDLIRMDIAEAIPDTDKR